MATLTFSGNPAVAVGAGAETTGRVVRPYVGDVAQPPPELDWIWLYPLGYTLGRYVENVGRTGAGALTALCCRT
jgi:hypothetical protein